MFFFPSDLVGTDLTGPLEHDRKMDEPVTLKRLHFTSSLQIWFEVGVESGNASFVLPAHPEGSRGRSISLDSFSLDATFRIFWPLFMLWDAVLSHTKKDEVMHHQLVCCETERVLEQVQREAGLQLWVFFLGFFLPPGWLRCWKGRHWEPQWQERINFFIPSFLLAKPRTFEILCVFSYYFCRKSDRKGSRFGGFNSRVLFFSFFCFFVFSHLPVKVPLLQGALRVPAAAQHKVACSLTCRSPHQTEPWALTSSQGPCKSTVAGWSGPCRSAVYIEATAEAPITGLCSVLNWFSITNPCSWALGWCSVCLNYCIQTKVCWRVDHSNNIFNAASIFVYLWKLSKSVFCFLGVCSSPKSAFY